MKKITFTKWGTILLIALLVLALAGIPVIYSRYAARTESQTKLATPEAFYFECNFEDGGLYLYPAGRDFTFEVMNHNALGNVSKSNVSYTVSVDSTPVTPIGGGEPLLNGGSEDSQNFKIDSTLLETGKKYTIKITSSAPFEKTISYQIFVVEDTVENFYSVSDHGNWVQLDLYIGTAEPNSLTVQYGDQLAPDNTHPLMRAWKTSDGQATLTDTELHPYTHYTLIFFGDKNVATVENAPLPETVILQ